MSREEDYTMREWLEAGVGVPVDAEPPVSGLRKGFVEKVEGGYALTERGARYIRPYTFPVSS